jgi:hypothetical protein
MSKRNLKTLADLLTEQKRLIVVQGFLSEQLETVKQDLRDISRQSQAILRAQQQAMRPSND